MTREKRLRVRPTDEHLKYVDTVFLFGAGTSAHMKLSKFDDAPCVPTDALFFDVVKDDVLKRWCTDPKILEIAQNAHKRVFGALRDAGVSKEQLIIQQGNKYPEVGLEEVFCRLDMLRMLGEYVIEKGRHERLYGLLNTILTATNGLPLGKALSNMDIRASLDQYITTLPEWGEWKHPVEALRDLIAVVMAYGRPPADETGYTGFARRILVNHEKRNANTYAVLCLNYEFGLEFAIHDLFRSHQSVFIALREIIKAQKIRPEEVGLGSLFHYALPNRSPLLTSEAMPILKLHGSCNWGFCPQCENVMHVPMEWGSHEVEIDRLVGGAGARKVCHWHAADHPLLPRYVPHIVPPTWNKWMGDYTLRHVWRQAYSVLANCTKLFVVGTSLPETDTHLRHLIRMAFARMNKAPQVYVVNPICENERDQYTQRVEAALGMTVGPENYLWEPFQNRKTLDWIFDKAREHSE